MSRSSRWLAGLMVVAIIGVVTAYVMIDGDDTEPASRGERSETSSDGRSASSSSASSSSGVTRRDERERRIDFVSDAGPLRIPIGSFAPRIGAEGATGTVGSIGSTAPPAQPSEPADIPPEVLLRRARGLQQGLEQHITKLREQRVEAVAARDEARLTRIDRFIERLEGERPVMEARIRELEREAAAHPAP